MRSASNKLCHYRGPPSHPAPHSSLLISFIGSKCLGWLADSAAKPLQTTVKNARLQVPTPDRRAVIGQEAGPLTALGLAASDKQSAETPNVAFLSRWLARLKQRWLPGTREDRSHGLTMLCTYSSSLTKQSRGGAKYFLKRLQAMARP